MRSVLFVTSLHRSDAYHKISPNRGENWQMEYKRVIQKLCLGRKILPFLGKFLDINEQNVEIKEQNAG